MGSPSKTHRKWVAGALGVGLLVISACAVAPQQTATDEFLIVPLSEGLSLSDLAGRYLGDSGKDWRLVPVDKPSEPHSTKEVLVPLIPLGAGGLHAEGYQTVPVLRYRRFAKAATDKATVSQASFEAQMSYLKQNGYRVIGLVELLGFMEFKEEIPPKAVVITIDDGWHDTLDIAMPILKKYGFPATLFVRTELIERSHALSWLELKLLSANGFDIQCSAPAAPQFAGMRDKDAFVAYLKELDHQLSATQEAFRKYLQKDCDCVAYPAGKANNLTAALIRRQGFRAGFLINDEPNPFFADPYFIGRSMVSGEEDLDDFKPKLRVFRKWLLD